MGRRTKKSKRSIRRKNRILLFRLTSLIIILLIAIFLIKGVWARYKSSTDSQLQVDLAYYLLNAGSISQDLKLQSLLPRSNPYTYSFSIANNRDGDRTETALEYTIELKTTTNLPLQFKIYKQNTVEDMITSTTESRDEDDTYFKYFVTISDNLGFNQNEQKVYYLDIMFPEQYNLAEYEGIIEYLQLTVNSKQRI